MRQAARIAFVALLVVGAAVSAGVGTVAATTATQEDCRYPVQAVDASGEKAVVEQEPERVVTLNPSAAQTLWEIGAQEKVVGVSQFAGFLDGAESREVVTKGFPSTVQTEKVLSLDPDLVLAPNTIDNETVSKLRQANITVYRFRLATSIEDVYAKTERIGRLVGACQGAAETVAGMQERIDHVRQAVAGQDRPTVMYVSGEQLYSPGPNTFIGGMIEAAGGYNIAADANSTRPYPKLSPEFIAQQDPEWLVVPYTAANANKSAKELVPDSPALKNTTAYEEGNIVKVNANHVSQPAPRIVQPVEAMAKAFHPEAYAAANQTTTTTADTTETTTTDSVNADPTDTTTSDGQPGFTAGVAAVALAGAALVAFRRY
jgi:iron complex transport system substrate-binding protein